MRTSTMTHISRYFLFLIVICSTLLYIVPVPNSIIKNIVTSYSIKSTLSSKQVCYLPDGTTHRSDRLRKLTPQELSAISAYISDNDSLTISYISKNFANFTEFLDNAREAIMARRLVRNTRSIPTIFRNPPHQDMVKPSCDGLWMEFGVFRGTSLTHIADWKRLFCSNTSEPVYGFDTFTGLPGEWRGKFVHGVFAIPDGTNISVPDNTVLVKGLFIDTLPNQLLLLDRVYRCHTPVSFVHIDCDLYDGTRDILFLLGSRFQSGTILVFDELFNYPEYEQHELKALFEFLSGSNLRLIPVGSSTYIQRHPMKDVPIQSFAFVVDLERAV